MATITSSNLITGTLQTVDSLVNQLVQNGYTHLVQSHRLEINLLLTLYVLLYGYRVVTHTVSADLMTMARHLVLMLIIYSLLLHWPLFHLFFFNVFTNEPETMTKVLIQASGNHLAGGSVQDALNSYFTQGLSASARICEMTSIKNFLFIFYGALVAVLTAVSCIWGLFLLVYAKLATALILVVAPIFLVFALWTPTRSFFERWVQALLNYALMPILTTGVLLISLSIIQTTFPALNAASQQPNLFSIYPYLGLSLLNCLLLKQVPTLCAALSSGFALEGLGSAAMIVRNSLKTLGLSQKADKQIVAMNKEEDKKRKQEQINESTKKPVTTDAVIPKNNGGNIG
jgi:type IV secretion system protein VirB6